MKNARDNYQSLHRKKDEAELDVHNHIEHTILISKVQAQMSGLLTMVEISMVMHGAM